jgi:3'(2'), 5'-bisphosphate nucleotidase
MMTDSDLLDLASRLADQAGAAILRVRRSGYDVRHKEDDSPVTEADHAAEAIIAAGLRAATPEIPVIAEEEMAAGGVTAVTSQFWLVDPLDGTREFAAGNDEFAVNIGLVRNGRVALGVVFMPALDELFGGIVGKGAWKRHAGARHPIEARLPPAEGLAVVVSLRHGDQVQLARFLPGRRVARRVSYGSSLKFCRVAEGAADLYPRFGRTMEWDTCAPQAVVEAAGGTMRTVDRGPFLYGKPSWENPHFICAGRANA